MTGHEPLDAAGVEELRRAVEAWESAPVPSVILRTPESEAAMIAKLVSYRHRILASLDLLAKGVEGRATFENVALAFVPPHKYRATLVTPDRVHGRVLVIPLPEETADDR